MTVTLQHVDSLGRGDRLLAGVFDSAAENAALADHNCEHAWGGLGLFEC